MRGVHVALIAVAAGVLSACGTPVDTTKETFPRSTVPAAEGMQTGATGKPKANDPVFSNEVLRTLDPCALLSEDLLASLGTPDTNRPDYFSNCGNYMEDKDGKDLSVILYLGETLSGASSADENFGGLPGFISELDDHTACFANAVTTTNPNMGLRVQIGGDAKQELCDIATTVMVAVVDRIRTDPPEREARSGSLATVDPCALLSSDDLEPALGSDTTTDPYNLHWCNWNGDGVSASVWFRTGYDPKDSTTDPGTPVDLGGGLTAYQAGSTDGAANCRLEWRHRSGGADGEDEIIEVDVTKSDPPAGDNGCPAAIAMAKLLVPTLPTP